MYDGVYDDVCDEMYDEMCGEEFYQLYATNERWSLSTSLPLPSAHSLPLLAVAILLFDDVELALHCCKSPLPNFAFDHTAQDCR
jgi:hypothetical protein